MDNIRVRLAPGVPQSNILLPQPVSLSAGAEGVTTTQQTAKKEDYEVEGLPLQSALWSQQRKALDHQKKSLVYNNLSVLTDKYGGDIMAFQRSSEGKKFFTSLVELEKGYMQTDLNKSLIEEQKKTYDKVMAETLSNNAMTAAAMNQRNQYLYMDDSGNLKADTYANPERAYLTMGDYLQYALTAGYEGGSPEMLPIMDTVKAGTFNTFLDTMVNRITDSMQTFISSETKEGKETGYKFSQSSNDRAIKMLNAVVYDQLATDPEALREAKSLYYTATGGNYLEGQTNPNTKKPYSDEEKFRSWVTSLAAERAELERKYSIHIADQPSEAQKTMEYLGGLTQQTYASAMMDKDVMIALSAGNTMNVNMPFKKDGKVDVEGKAYPVARHATDYINRENELITSYSSDGNVVYKQDAKTSPYLISMLDAMGGLLSRADLKSIPGQVRIKEISDEIVYAPRMKTNPKTGEDIPEADEGNLQMWRRIYLIADREWMKNYVTYYPGKKGTLEVGTPAHKSWFAGGIQEDFIKRNLGGWVINKDDPAALGEKGNKEESYVISGLIPDKFVNAAPNILSRTASKEVTEYVNTILGQQAQSTWIDEITQEYIRQLSKFEVK